MHVDAEEENKFEKVYGKQFWLSGPDLQHPVSSPAAKPDNQNSKQLFSMSLHLQTSWHWWLRTMLGWLWRVMHFDFSCPGWWLLHVTLSKILSCWKGAKSFASVEKADDRGTAVRTIAKASDNHWDCSWGSGTRERHLTLGPRMFVFMGMTPMYRMRE